MRAFFFLFLVLFAAAASALTLNNEYNARLNEKLAFYGSEAGLTTSTLCSLYIIDANSGKPVDRWSDEYSFNGNVFFEKTLTQPPYFVGDDYNAVVVCGNYQQDALFQVEQPLTFAHQAQTTWEYMFLPGNRSLYLWGFFFFGILILILLVYYVILRGLR